MRYGFSFRSISIISLILLVFVGFSLFFIQNENVSLDEGIYLYAANQVYQGQRLYHDFIFAHLPTLPYFYGAGQKLFRKGILSGRYTSFALYLVTILLVGAVCAKHFNAPTAYLAMALLAWKNFNLINLNLVFTYPLALFFLLLAVFCAFEEESGPIQYFWVSIFVFLAVSGRLLLIFVLPLFWAYLWRSNSRNTKIKEFAYTLAALCLFMLFLSPFILKSPGNFWFDIYGQYATKRSVAYGEFFAGRKHYLTGTLRYYWPELVILFFFMAALFLRWRQEGKLFLRDLKSHPKIVFLSCLTIMLTAATFLLPPFSYPLHNLVVAPNLAILIAWGLVAACQSKTNWIKRVSLAGIAGLLLIFLFQNGLRVNTDLNKGYNSIQRIKQIAKMVQQYTKPTEKLLTFSTYLALASDRQVLAGLEQSGFACLFNQPEALCLQRKATSPQLLNTAIERQQAGLVILSVSELGRYQFTRLETLVNNLSRHYFIAAKVDSPSPPNEKWTLWLPDYKTEFPPAEASAAYWSETADILASRGQFKRAVLLANKVVELKPTPQGYYKLAVFQYNDDKPQQAMRSLNETLKLAPNFKAAIEKRDYLRRRLSKYSL